MLKVHDDRLASLSRLYSYGRSLYSIQNGCRISHAWIFKVTVCGSWKENCHKIHIIHVFVVFISCLHFHVSCLHVQI